MTPLQLIVAETPVTIPTRSKETSQSAFLSSQEIEICAQAERSGKSVNVEAEKQKGRVRAFGQELEVVDRAQL